MFVYIFGVEPSLDLGDLLPLSLARFTSLDDIPLHSLIGMGAPDELDLSWEMIDRLKKCNRLWNGQGLGLYHIAWPRFYAIFGEGAHTIEIQRVWLELFVDIVGAVAVIDRSDARELLAFFSSVEIISIDPLVIDRRPFKCYRGYVA